jgi:alanine or glycine:cation symporter, AGCS family
MLSGLAIKLMRDYNRTAGAARVEPVFDVSRYPDIARRIVKGSW